MEVPISHPLLFLLRFLLSGLSESYFVSLSSRPPLEVDVVRDKDSWRVTGDDNENEDDSPLLP